MYDMGSILRKRVELNPERLALVFKEERLTYRALNSRVNKLAQAFAGRRIKKGDRVAVLLMNSSRFLECYFAAAKLGAVLYPVNFRLAGPEILFQVNDCTPKLMVAGAQFQALIAGIRQEMKSVKHCLLVGGEAAGFESYEAALAAGEDREPDASVGETDPFIIMYSSGTTGRPKGATLTHENNLWNSLNGIIDFGIRQDDVTLVAAPLFHVGALNILTIPHLHLGATAVIQEAFNPKEALELIQKERVTNMFAVPTMFNFMLQVPGIESYDLKSLRFLVSGGSPCPIPIIEGFSKFGVVFMQGYGMTETSPSALLLRAADAVRKAGSVGKPFVHVEVKVVNEKGQEIQPGEVGEVLIRGKSVMKGYWKNPEATAEAIQDGWMRSGDLARVDEDGYIYIVDRKKDMIISGGENIYPAEVEQVLYKHPEVLEAAVIGVPDPKWGESALALVVAKPGTSPAPENLIEHCRRNLAKYKCPKRVEVVKELPRTPAGKVLKRVLREQYQ